MKLLSRTSILLMLGLAIISCSTVQKENPEKEIRIFLSSFQNDLTKSNSEILNKFRVKQSNDALLSLISILQNKDPYIVCDASIINAIIFLDQENKAAMVEIPATFRVKELNSTDTASQPLIMRIDKNENGFTIAQVNGEEFFQAFTKIKNKNQWKAMQKQALEDRSLIYENARYLEEKFDSVIWFTKYRNQNYFYVVDGGWSNYFLDRNESERIEDTRMGLVDADGQIIIPIEYDLIGTIGFDNKDLVEITKDGKHGYFSLAQKVMVVDPVFDLIVPYDQEEIWLLVRQDTTYGWIDNQYLYTQGLPSEEIKTYLKNYDFLKRPVTLSTKNGSACEIPTEEYIGNGIIIPPSYLSIHGIFNEIEVGFVTNEMTMNAWTEYKETQGSFLETLSSNIRAVVTSIRERYLEGREEFYENNKVIFIDKNNTQLSTVDIYGEQASIQAIDSTLIEVRNPHDYWFLEEDASEETNLTHHSYIAISEKYEITQLKSRRLFPQTEFVKLDSSYITGNFIVYDYSTDKEKNTTFLSTKTLTHMKNEILASYGFDFEDKELNERFEYVRKEKGLRLSFDQFEVLMSDIDEYNLNFLNKILTHLEEQSSTNPV